MKSARHAAMDEVNFRQAQLAEKKFLFEPKLGMSSTPVYCALVGFYTAISLFDVR